jgi:hypothetical protein
MKMRMKINKAPDQTRRVPSKILPKLLRNYKQDLMDMLEIFQRGELLLLQLWHYYFASK